MGQFNIIEAMQTLLNDESQITAVQNKALAILQASTYGKRNDIKPTDAFLLVTTAVTDYIVSLGNKGNFYPLTSDEIAHEVSLKLDNKDYIENYIKKINAQARAGFDPLQVGG